jgi:hypothetical protein
VRDEILIKNNVRKLASGQGIKADELDFPPAFLSIFVRLKQN